jgi:hypothetical protein
MVRTGAGQTERNKRRECHCAPSPDSARMRAHTCIHQTLRTGSGPVLVLRDDLRQLEQPPMLAQHVSAPLRNTPIVSAWQSCGTCALSTRKRGALAETFIRVESHYLVLVVATWHLQVRRHMPQYTTNSNPWHHSTSPHDASGQHNRAGMDEVRTLLSFARSPHALAPSARGQSGSPCWYCPNH